MPRAGAAPKMTGKPPSAFRIQRDLPLGRHPLLLAFPGLDRLDTAERHEPDAKKRARLHAGTFVEIVPEDVWMYVAPHEVPKGARGRWKPVLSEGSDCIVIGEQHFRSSPELIVFMDIFHELCHIRQRQAGLELWDDHYGYAERPTEVEAYRFVIDEARRLGVKDDILRDYLKVEWIDRKEYRLLLRTMDVPVE